VLGREHTPNSALAIPAYSLLGLLSVRPVCRDVCIPSRSSAAQILYVPCNPLLPSSKHPSLHSKRRGATLHTNEWLRQRVYATPRWDEGGRTRCLHQPTSEGRSN
jgi:hypothetical protein